MPTMTELAALTAARPARRARREDRRLRRLGDADRVPRRRGRRGAHRGARGGRHLRRLATWARPRVPARAPPTSSTRCLTNDLRRIGAGPGAVHAVLHRDRRRRRRPDRLPALGRRRLPHPERRQHRRGGRRCSRPPRPRASRSTNLHDEYGVLAVQGPRSDEVLRGARLPGRPRLHELRRDRLGGRCRSSSAAPATPASAATSSCRRGTSPARLWDALAAAVAAVGRAARRPRRPRHAAHRDGLPAARPGPLARHHPGAGRRRLGRRLGQAAVLGPRRAARRAARPSSPGCCAGSWSTGRGIPRSHCAVKDATGAVVGEVTSGTFSPDPASRASRWRCSTGR